MTSEDFEYLKSKRLEVLEAIKPICEAFKITEYDYLVSETSPTEMLKIYDTKIGCASNSTSAIIDELIGWIFVKIYCRKRYIGAFQTQTLNVIKKYWKSEGDSK